MFSQKYYDEATIEELAIVIRKLSYSIENNADDLDEVYDYSNSLCNIADALHRKITELVL
jgi:hypothetical protein